MGFINFNNAINWEYIWLNHAWSCNVWTFHTHTCFLSEILCFGTQYLQLYFIPFSIKSHQNKILSHSPNKHFWTSVTSNYYISFKSNSTLHKREGIMAFFPRKITNNTEVNVRSWNLRHPCHTLATNGTKEIGREKVPILIGILSRTHSLNSFKSSFAAITGFFYGGNIRISNNRMIIECDVFSSDPTGWFRDSRGHVVQYLKETFMAFLVSCRLKFSAMRIQNKRLSTS